MHSPPGTRHLRVGAWSLLFDLAGLRRLALLFVLLLAVLAVSLMAGARWLTPAELARAASGDGALGLLLELRLPRVLVGLMAGAALGCAGWLLQTLSGNRLATPDILGVADGAALAIFLVLAGASMMGPWWVGPLGGLAAVALLLAASGGIGLRGHTVLVVGLGLASLLRAATEIALSRQELMHASALYAWSVGSLNGRGFDSAPPLAFGLAVLLPLSLLAARRLALLRFDPDLARALGLPLRATQWQALITAVLLSSLAIGVCGPIAFVALAAPFFAGRAGMPGAVLAGAALVAAADTLGRSVIGSVELPAGVICNLLGGPFLLWLLLRERQGDLQ